MLPERSGIGATVLSNFMTREQALVNATGTTHLTQSTLKRFVMYGAAAQRGPWPPPILEVSRSHTRRITVGRTPLDE